MWVDSHCHLNHKNINDLGDPDTIIAQAKANSTDALVTICCRIAEEASHLQDIAARHDHVWCTIGTHPHDSGLDTEQAITEDEIVTMVTANDNVIGIGETGLDYYYNNSPKDDQIQSFRKHLRACVRADVPVIIHTRDADEDTATIIEEEYRASGGALKGLLHCFSSGEQLAQRALDIGFYISFSGILTFKRSDELRDIAKNIPVDRLLVETDAPFLAPQAMRGKVNSPAYVHHVGEMLADLHDMSAEDMARITSENFYRLFSKAKG